MKDGNEGIEVAMAVVRRPGGEFLAMHKNLDRTDKQRYRRNPWETPGGKIKPGEDPVEAAVREVDEETGFTVDPAAEGYSHEEMRVHDSGQGIDFFPVALELSGGTDVEQMELSEEHDRAEWLSPEDFRERLPEHNVRGFKRARRCFG